MVVLTVACTQAGQSAVTSPTPTPASSPSPATSPSPVPGDLPVTQVSFSCRLPIYHQTGYVDMNLSELHVVDVAPPLPLGSIVIVAAGKLMNVKQAGS